MTYIGILFLGTAIFAAIPFILYAFHKSELEIERLGLRTVRMGNQEIQDHRSELI